MKLSTPHPRPNKHTPQTIPLEFPVHRPSRRKRAVEMTGLWKAWKAKNRLPPLSTSPLEISPRARFPHSHSSGDEADGKVENQQQVSHFPIAQSLSLKAKKTTTSSGGLSPSARAGAPRLPPPRHLTTSVTFIGEATRFVESLSTAWRDGEIRPTHRRQSTGPRSWRTRIDPFESVWPVVERWLEDRPDANAKELFHRLQSEMSAPFEQGQLRTLQRRVKEWRTAIARRLVLSGGVEAEHSAPATEQTYATDDSAGVPRPSTITT